MDTLPELSVHTTYKRHISVLYTFNLGYESTKGRIFLYFAYMTLMTELSIVFLAIIHLVRAQNFPRGYYYFPAGNYMFEVNNRNTRTRCEI